MAEMKASTKEDMPLKILSFLFFQIDQGIVKMHLHIEISQLGNAPSVTVLPNPHTPLTFVDEMISFKKKKNIDEMVPKIQSMITFQKKYD